MKIATWDCDFSSLPYWEDREHIPFIYDTFCEVPQSDALCCIYSIAEVSMGDYRGFLAIFKQKNAPRLYLNVTTVNFRDQMCANKEGNLLFLRPHIYEPEVKVVKEPVIVIDIQNDLFTYFDMENKYLDENMDNEWCEHLLASNERPWYPLKDLNLLQQMINNSIPS